MHYLVNGIVATGADVFHPGQSPAPTDDHGGASDTKAVSSSPSQVTILNDAVAIEISDDERQTNVSHSNVILFKSNYLH